MKALRVRQLIKRWFDVKEFFLPLAINLDFKKIKEFTILPKNGEFYLECSYEVERINMKLDINSKPQTFGNERKNQGFSLREQGGKQHWFKGDRIRLTSDIA